MKTVDHFLESLLQLPLPHLVALVVLAAFALAAFTIYAVLAMAHKGGSR